LFARFENFTTFLDLERIMTRGSVSILFLALNVSACGAVDVPQAPLEFTPSESASLDRIFVDIKRAGRESFDKNEWSIMAKLYPGNSLTCWNASAEDHRFGFLSMKPIPENAQYTVASLENYMFGGVDTSKMGGTHFMSIRYTETFLEGCDVPVKKRWPERHFYLKREGGKFQLVHPCPLQEQIDQKSIARVWPVTSAGRAADTVARMSASELDGLRQQVKRDAFPLNAINSIQDRYKLTEDEAAMALERICKSKPAS
jgi:hypothetical protein